MPSPIAHSLAGLALGHALAPEQLRGRAAWYGFALVAANAADLDFLAGLVTGSINALHGGPSHSLGSAVAFATVSALLLGVRRRRAGAIFLAAAAIYASHVLLDMACEPSPKRPGLPLLWPVSGQEFLFPWRPLLGIMHGGHGGGLADFVRELFSVHNLGAVGIEVAAFSPPLWLAFRRWGVPECLQRGSRKPVEAAGDG